MASDYATKATLEERLAGANGYLAELQAIASSPDVSDGSRSVNYGSLQTAIAGVRADIVRYEQQLAATQVKTRRVLGRSAPY